MDLFSSVAQKLSQLNNKNSSPYMSVPNKANVLGITVPASQAKVNNILSSKSSSSKSSSSKNKSTSKTPSVADTLLSLPKSLGLVGSVNAAEDGATMQTSTSPVRRVLGNTADVLGTAGRLGGLGPLGLLLGQGDYRLSENIAGGNTLNTQNYQNGINGRNDLLRQLTQGTPDVTTANNYMSIGADIPQEPSLSTYDPNSISIPGGYSATPSTGGASSGVSGAGTGGVSQDLLSALGLDQSAQLQGINNTYDEATSALQDQLGQSNRDLKDQLGTLNTQYANNLTAAEQSNEAAKQADLATAQNTQNTNRNVLRALGILNSSAAGEMLTKPFNEYDKQVGQLTNQLESWKNEQLSTLTLQAQQLKSRYLTQIENIKRDLRFNDRQKSQAIAAANAAMAEQMATIKQQAYTTSKTADNAVNTLSSLGTNPVEVSLGMSLPQYH